MSSKKDTASRDIRSRPLPSLQKVWAEIGLKNRFEFRVACVRPDDLLVCDFIFENLRLDSTGSGTPKLIRKDSSTPVLIVEFPPQSFGEEAFLDVAGKPGLDVPKNETFPEKSTLVQVNKTHRIRQLLYRTYQVRVFACQARAAFRIVFPARLCGHSDLL